MFGHVQTTDRSRRQGGRFRARTLTRAALLGSACALALAPSSVADPNGGVVVGGQATIVGQNTSSTTINQSSQNAIINWNDFSIDAGGSVTFNQPGATAITLNRVVGEDPSTILGQLTANGRIVIVNPNGVMFGQGARVDVAGLVATTHDIADDDFMAGSLNFSRSSGSNGFVVNEGLITVDEAGLAAFVAPSVRNSGVIAARLGTVQLASATKFTVDFYGDNLISFPVDSRLLSAPVGADGAPVDALVVNDGSIVAEGGSILMTASAARGVIDDVILAGGELAATSFSSEGGRIVLYGEGGGVYADGALDASGATAGGTIDMTGDWVSVGGSLTADGASGGAVDIAAGGLSLAGDISATGSSGAGGAVTIGVERSSVELASASIDVSGATGGSIRNTAGRQITSSAAYDASGSSGAGGRIDLSAGALKLLSASLDASGASGGRVRLGGEFQGGAGLSADELPNALLLAVSNGTNIDVSASAAGGSGGQAIVWSDLDTMFLGSVDARGAGGAGGFVEVSSGGVLNFNGDIRTGGGEVLLDPKNLTIVADSFSQLALILGYNYSTPHPNAANNALASGADALAQDDFFGQAVSLDGTRLAVGAPGADGGGLGGDAGSGAVYLFTFADEAFTSPTLVGVLGEGYSGGNNVSLSAGAGFGSGVSLDGDRLAVGAPSQNGVGAVYLFTFDPGLTNAVLSGSIGEGSLGGVHNLDLNGPSSSLLTGNDFFGVSVSLDGDRLAVGAVGDDGHTTPPGTEDFGAVYLFSFADEDFSGAVLEGRMGFAYAVDKDVNVPTLHSGNGFGSAVALDGDLLAVGAGSDSSGGVGSSGAVYLFSFDHSSTHFGGGAQLGSIGDGANHSFNLSVLDSEDFFGAAVALDGGRLAVGASLGDGAGENVTNSGEVYLFSFSGDFADLTHTGTVGGGHVGAGDINVANLGINDHFRSVALDGGRMAIGASEDGGFNNGLARSGAVYLFDLTNGSPTSPGSATFANNPGADSFISVGSLLALLNAGNSVVTLQANNDITVAVDVIVNNVGGDGGDLVLEAGRSILVNGSIDTDNGDLTLIANHPGADPLHRDAGDAVIAMANGVTIDTGDGDFFASIANGLGTTGAITLGGITGASVTAENLVAGDVTLNGALTATGGGDSVVLAATNGNFINGGGSISTPGGRFIVYAADPELSSNGGLLGTPFYNTVYDGANAGLPSGDVFAYAREVFLTVTPNGTRVYGDPDGAYAFTAGGLINGDLQTNALAGTPTFLPPALDADVGSYAFAMSGLTSPYNYTIQYVDGSFTITARPVTVAVDVGQGKVYGALEPTLGYTITSGDLVSGDGFTGALDREAGEIVGSYLIGAGDLSLGANYDLTINTGPSFVITPRGVTVTADPGQGKVYGDLDPTLGYTITSGTVISGDDFTGALDREDGEDVGSYLIGDGDLSLGSNYVLTVIGDQFVIAPRGVTVTVDPGQGKVYGDLDPTLGYTITSGTVVSGDGFTGALARAGDENVGDYAINAGTLSLGSNYDLTVTTGPQFAITPRAITVTADSFNKIYGEDDPDLTYDITSGSLAFNDGFTGDLIRLGGENVGSYAIGQGTLALNSNYDLTYVAGTLTVTPAALFISANDATRLYGDANPVFSATFDGLKAGDTGAVVSGLTFSTTATQSSNVGLYDIVASGGTATNYTITLDSTPGTLTVNPAPLTVTVNDVARLQDEPNPPLTANITGFKLGQNASVVSGLVLSTSATTGSAPGDYAITSSGGLAQNYVITTRIDGVFTILSGADVLNAIGQVQNEGQGVGGGDAPAGGDSAAFVFAATGSTGAGASDQDASLGLICTLADTRECPVADDGAE